MTSDVYDPKGLVREAFAMEGIGAPECRSIFLDWALGVPVERDTKTEVSAPPKLCPTIRKSNPGLFWRSSAALSRLIMCR